MSATESIVVKGQTYTDWDQVKIHRLLSISLSNCE